MKRLLLLGLAVGCGLAGLAGPTFAADAPTVVALQPPALPITVSGTGTLTVTLSAAPEADTDVTVSSSDTNVATVPATVTVTAGTLSAGFAVTGVAAGTVTITATLNSTNVYATITVSSATLTVTGLSPPTLQVSQGASASLTVTLSAAAGTATDVALSSSDTGIVSLPDPATVTIPAGQRSAPFTVTGVTAGRATLTATLNSTSAQTPVTVVTGSPTVVRLLPPTHPLTVGGTGTLTATLSATSSTATDVTLSTSDPAIITLPGTTLTIPANTLAASFTVTGAARGLATVTATLGSSSAAVALEVQPAPPPLGTLTCPLTLATGTVALCTVRLAAAPLAPIVVSLSSDATGTASVPASVTVLPGAPEAQVAVTGVAEGSATLTAGPVSGITRTAAVQVVASSLTISGLTPASAALVAGTTVPLTLTLSAAPATDTSVSLSSSAPSVASTPAAVVVPAGARSTTVIVTGAAAGTATLTAGPLGGTSAQSAVTVNADAPTLTALSPSTLSLPKGKTGTLTVTITPTQTGATAVPLSSSASNTVDVPASVPIPAGEREAAVPLLARTIGTATITAGPLGGTSQQATVTVTAPAIVTVAVTPAEASIPKGLTQQFTAMTTLTDGTTADVTSTATWTSSNTSVATINASGRAAGVAPGTTQITATKDGITSPPVTLTVTSPVIVSIAVTPTAPSIPKGRTQQFTAVATLSDSTTQNVTTTAVWESSNAGVATITPTGLATGVGEGTSQITASQDGVTSPPATLTVTAPVLVSLAIAPSSGIAPAGGTQAFTATGTFSDDSTQNLTASVMWSSNNTAVASIAAGGVATGVAAGLAQVRAQSASVSAIAFLTVVEGLPAVTAYLPERAFVGRAFTLRGLGFSPSPAGNMVTFAGAGGTRLPATVTAASSTELTVTVPAGAQTGAVTVEVAGRSASLWIPAGPAPEPTLYSVGHRHSAVALDPGLGLAALVNSDNGSLTLFDLASGSAVATVLNVYGFSKLAINTSTHMAVLAYNFYYLQLVDLVARQAVALFVPELEVDGTRINPGRISGLAVDAARNQAILSAQDDHLWVVDLAARRALRRVPVGGHGPLALDAARSVAVLLPEAVAVRATIVDLTAARVREEIPLLWAGTAMAIDPATQRAIVNAGFVLDLAARMVLGITPLGGTALDGGASLVATTAQNVLVFWDLRTGGEVGRVPLGTLTPRGLALDPAGQRALVYGDVGPSPPSSTLAIVPYGVFVPGPRLDAFTPDIAAPGATLALRGDSLGTATVTVVGTGGARLVTPPATGPPSSRNVAIPAGAAIGPVQVVTATGMTPSLLSLTVPAPALMVQITAPRAGQSVPVGRLAVSGTVTPASPTTTVTVNGVPAVVWGDRWAAVNVPVPFIFPNHPITAEARDAEGRTASVTINVNGGSDAPSRVSLAAAPPAGPAPFAPALTVTTDLPPPSPANNYLLDTDVGGTVSITGLPLPRVSYFRPGLYTPGVTAFDGGTRHPAQVVVRVDFPAPPSALTGVTVTPGASVGTGEAQFLAAMATFADGTSREVTTLATWQVDDPAVASVSPAGTVIGLAAGLTTVSATYQGAIGAAPVAVTGPVVATLRVRPLPYTGIYFAPPPQVHQGLVQPFLATGIRTDGTQVDLTGEVAWSSSTPAVAPIDSAGVGSALSSGMTTITARLGPLQASWPMTVITPAIQGVRVAIVLDSFAPPVGRALHLDAFAGLGGAEVVAADARLRWSSSDATVATVAPGGGFLARGPGRAIISGCGVTLCGRVGVIVTAQPVTDARLEPSTPPPLPVGSTQALTFVGRLGTTPPLPEVDLTPVARWSSSNTAVATVDATGLVTIQGTGTATITGTVVRGPAGSDEFTRSVAVQGIAASVARIEIAPPNPTLLIGGTQGLTATAISTDGARQDVTGTATWASDALGIATVDATGGVAAIARGTAPITAAALGRTGTAYVTVVPGGLTLNSITLNPSAPITLMVGGPPATVQAIGTFADSSTQDFTRAVRWRTGDPNVADVTAPGVVTPKGSGLTAVQARYFTLFDDTTVRVLAAPGTLTITPRDAPLPKGAAQPFVATLTRAGENPRDVTGQATWTSTAPAVASVTAGGLVRARTPGTTRIQATFTDSASGATLTDDTGLTVGAAAPVALAVTPTQPVLVVGQTQPLTALAQLSDGATADWTTQAAWSSSATTIVTVNPSGQLTAMAAGAATITARAGTVTATVPVTILATSAAPMVTTLNPATGPVGSLVTLTGTNLIGTLTVTFGTGPAVAPVGRTATAVTVVVPVGSASGPVTVTTLTGSATAPVPFTVTPGPSVAITSPAAGDRLTKAQILVRGRALSATGEVGVVVNGIPALVHGTDWVVSLPITSGPNVLTAVVTDPTGAAARHSVPATGDNPVVSPLTLSAFPLGGEPPLTVTFRLDNVPSRPAAQFALDADGDGTPDMVGETFAEPTFTYTTPGLYFPRLTVTDDQGTRYTATTVVKVGGTPPLVAKWEALKDALRRGDVPAALQFIHSKVRSDYQAFFAQLTPAQLALVDQVLTTLVPVEVTAGGAEYYMERLEDGQTLSFPVFFEMDMDGLWRIRMF